jgi:prepilin-type N-terminal cleavage/methylation domain-containing protein
MSIKSKNSGFTLIELIFVVAIIGVTIAIGLSYMEKLAERTKEKTTSLQIQQILQAAMTYYVAKNTWPSDGNTTSAGDFADYIPAIDRLATNSWGVNNYSWTAQTSGGKLFTVSTVVPDNDTAARIASSLPNATNTTTTVNSQIAIPGQAQTVFRGYVIRAGELSSINLGECDTKDTTDSPIQIATDDDTDVQPCILAGGTVKIMPYIKSYELQIHNSGNSTSMKAEMELSEAACAVPTGHYCISYRLHGGGSGAEDRCMYPDSVIIAYTVLCLPTT